MGLKESLNSNKFTSSIYQFVKKRRDIEIAKRKLKFHGNFINRSSGSNKLCIVLAGYKSFLYEMVFERLVSFIPKDYDICVVSSGKYDGILNEICNNNHWSYLSVKENNVALVQNVAISLHPYADYIFKIDEDIFITKDYFEKMINAYESASNGDYMPGIIAPLIPINGFTHKIVLKHMNLEPLYEKLFEKPVYMSGPNRMIESSSEVAKFFWGQGNYIPQIDELNEMFTKANMGILPCPIRFSIGAILFRRELIEGMGYLPVHRLSSGLGLDEMDICSYCINYSRPIMIATNTVVGHFSFGRQTTEMKEYFESNKNLFAVKTIEKNNNE